jgi:hypothetical protein
MIVSNLLFDIILFGALLASTLIDKSMPQTVGAASLIVVGLAVYISAQEWGDTLLRRRVWTQESLATAVALSVLGFIYFWLRNESDLALLALSITLMMASLMVAIATIAAISSAFRDKSSAPILGWFVTVGGGLVLGILGGALVLFLGGGATLFAKVLVLGIALFGWKIRETINPPAINIHAGGSAVQPENAEPEGDLVLPATHTQNWFFLPQRGTLLDRFMPVLVLGAILFVAARSIQSPDLWTQTPPAAADNASNSAPQ